MPNVQRTTINLDRDLVTQAAETLGTTRTTDTVHAALREVVAIEARLRLASREFDLTLEDIHRMRHEDPELDIG
jgi:Arc/MetJ family transcription regulator